MRQEVKVEKRMYYTGSIIIDASTLVEAENRVATLIAQGHLQTTNIPWSDPIYEDFTVKVRDWV